MKLLAHLSSIGFSIGLQIVAAGELSVFVNGEACGKLEQLAVNASSITIISDRDCGEPITPSVDPACVGAQSVCDDFKLLINVSDNYDGHIDPGRRHVYHFTSPALDADSNEPNYVIMFTVIDHGAIAVLKLGLSKVKGRIEPQGDELAECFSDARTQLSLTGGTDSTYAECMIEPDTDYYFTIVNVEDAQAGDYRFQFKKPSYY